MKNKKKYIIGTLALVFILIGIIGNQQAQGNNTEKIYSFWDGLKNGAGNTYRPEGTKANFGYGVGIWIGRIWEIIFSLLCAIYCCTIGKSIGEGILYFFAGIGLGYYVGILFGLAVYGTLNGILTSLKWVINTL